MCNNITGDDAEQPADPESPQAVLSKKVILYQSCKVFWYQSNSYFGRFFENCLSIKNDLKKNSTNKLIVFKVLEVLYATADGFEVPDEDPNLHDEGNIIKSDLNSRYI